MLEKVVNVKMENKPRSVLINQSCREKNHNQIRVNNCDSKVKFKSHDDFYKVKETSMSFNFLFIFITI